MTTFILEAQTQSSLATYIAITVSVFAIVMYFYAIRAHRAALAKIKREMEVIARSEHKENLPKLVVPERISHVRERVTYGPQSKSELQEEREASVQRYKRMVEEAIVNARSGTKRTFVLLILKASGKGILRVLLPTVIQSALGAILLYAVWTPDDALKDTVLGAIIGIYIGEPVRRTAQKLWQIFSLAWETLGSFEQLYRDKVVPEARRSTYGLIEKKTGLNMTEAPQDQNLGQINKY